MECFVIFVMAWCWYNATESKPQNVSRNSKKNREKLIIYEEFKFTTFLFDFCITIKL